MMVIKMYDEEDFTELIIDEVYQDGLLPISLLEHPNSNVVNKIQINLSKKSVIQLIDILKIKLNDF